MGSCDFGTSKGTGLDSAPSITLLPGSGGHPRKKKKRKKGGGEGRRFHRSLEGKAGRSTPGHSAL